jgi:asparagine synthase
LSKKLINPSKALMSGTGADELLGGYEALYF